jgi:RNA polymerase sigma-70 factor (ECF subfamily)
LTRQGRRIVLSADIIERLQSRDESACRELYDSAWASLLAIAAAIVQSPDAAEDVVQGIMFRVWERSEQLDPRVQLADYLVTAVRNASLSALRNDTRLRQRHDGLAAEIGVAEVKHDGDPVDDTLEWQEELEELRRVVSTLTEHQRTAFTLRYSLGKTNAEIARELGISLKGAEQLTARLKKLLRDRFRLPPHGDVG